MASKGETVKYVIDADTSGFARGMGEAAIESGVAGKAIDKNLSRTAKSSENNFRDIRRNAQTAASQIRNFGLAFQAFNTTSAIIGVTALSGAILELSGAVAAAGSTFSILLPAVTGAIAGVETFKVGIANLSDAFKALSKNDPKAWALAMAQLGPAAQSVAKSAGAIFHAFQDIQLNVQEKLWNDLGQTILDLGSTVLPVINTGMQQVAQAMNGALKSAASLASTPLFRGLLATIFQDTARNVGILAQALGPLLTIFTDLYAVTRPYVTLLANSFVTLTKQAAAYLSSARGQSALNLSIQEGLVALKELGGLVGSVFGLLTSVFRTSVNAGNSFIPTLTGIIKSMEAWVNSSKGQTQLIALFKFTSLAVQAVADSIGRALSFFFDMVQVVSNLSPAVQTLIVNFLATSLTLRPLISYLSQLYLAVRVLAVTLFNFVQQGIVVFGLLGTLASVALVVAAAFIVLGAIIKGPLGGALIIIGVALAAYIGLSFLLAGSNAAASASMFELGFAALAATEAEADLAGMSVLVASTMYAVAAAGLEAGEGLAAGASGAELLQVALIPLLVLAAGVFVILSLLGVFSGKAKQAQGAALGFGDALGGLQKAMKGVGSSASKTSDNGLSALNDSLGQTADAADTAQGSLASFDKMNVLTDNNTANAGIPGIPKLPNLAGGGALPAPTLDTGAFDKSIADMQKNFAGLQKNIGKPVPNPFQSLADWIDTHPWLLLGIFAGVLAIIVALFVTGAVAIGFAVLPLTLIVLAIIAIIAIIVILVKNWSTVWGFIKDMAEDGWKFIQNIWDSILDAATVMLALLLVPFQLAWDGIKAIWSVVVAFFTAIFDAIKVAVMFYINIYIQAFQLAWQGIQAAFGAAVSFFQAIWTGIQNAFSAVASFFGNIFSSAWTAIKNAFGAVTSFFQGIWNTIVSLFTSIGTAVGDAIGGAFKAVINGVLSGVQTVINAPINTINSLIKKINDIPGIPDLPTLGTITLPRLAKGGLITSPTFAQLGEAGTEAVMPLENNTGWIDMLAKKINASNGGSNGQPINLTVQIGEDKVASKIIDLINEKTQMSGRNTILV